MYPRDFEYHAPGSLEEALDVLAANPGAKVLSGGMSLIPMMKLRLFSPPHVVDIANIPGFDAIEDGGDHISIGAGVRHADIAVSDLVAESAVALSQAAAWTGDPQVRNRGTLCGAVAHADVAADQPCAVLALGATMVAASKEGAREIPAEEFFIDVLTSALRPDEILTEIRIPKSGSSAYDKLGRRGGHSDYAVAGAAAWVDRSNGSVTAARVALTGVSTRPVLADSVAAALEGSDGGAEAVAAAAAHAVDGVTVIEDLYGSQEYKAHLARVYVQRALSAALA